MADSVSGANAQLKEAAVHTSPKGARTPMAESVSGANTQLKEATVYTSPKGRAFFSRAWHRQRLETLPV
eukprot:1748770-Alexandrium_andersonii.AAC.1